VTDVLSGAPPLIARAALDLSELGHEPATASGLIVNTLRSLAAGKTLTGGKASYRVRNDCREAISEWVKHKLTLPEQVARGIEKVESSKKPISVEQAAVLAEKAEYRLSVVEGLLMALGSVGRRDEAARSRIIESAAKVLRREVEGNDLRSTLEAEAAVERFIKEALGYAKHPIKGERGRFHGMHGVEKAVRTRSLIPESEAAESHGAHDAHENQENQESQGNQEVQEAARKAPAPTTRRAAVAAPAGPSAGDRLAGAAGTATSGQFEQLHPRSQGGKFGSKGGGGKAATPAKAAAATTHPNIGTPEQVAALLDALGFDPADLSAALSAYQAKVGLKATGKIDPVTFQMLQQMAAKRNAGPAKGDVVLSGDQVSKESGSTHGPPTPRRARAKAKAATPATVKEATVVGNPLTPGSPSSQTGGTGTNQAWGGPNAAALAAILHGQRDGYATPRRDPFESSGPRVTDLLDLNARLRETKAARMEAFQEGDTSMYVRLVAREQALRELIKEATVNGSVREATTATDSRTLPDLPNKPGKSNWVEKAGGLPSYISRIAKHLHSEKGMDVSRAIATAVNVAKKMCASGDLNFKGKQNVNPDSRAQACKAVAEWEKKKGSAHLKEAADVVAHASELPGFAYPTVAECYEIVESMYEAEGTDALKARLAEAVERRKGASDSVEFTVARAHEVALREALAGRAA
jgi:hypothetical protein